MTALSATPLLGAPLGEGQATVILVHGITGNGLCLVRIAEEIGARRGGSVTVLSPDLRGRADARGLGEPYGIAQHADDILELAHAAQTPVVLLGHSMGAFVVAMAAAKEPDAIAGMLLLDGGFAFPIDPSLDADTAMNAVLGPAMARLTMTFADETSYFDFWGQHPAVSRLLADEATHEPTRRYLLHDLVPAPDGVSMVSSCVLAAIRQDGAEVLLDGAVHRAAHQAAEAGVPMELLWAARGMFDEPQGMYDEDRLSVIGLPKGMPVTKVDANHYSVILEPQAVGVVVDAIDRLLSK
ncbi:MAG: alpha/beta fold hydrolase [Dermatophilaceae bacterium]